MIRLKGGIFTMNAGKVSNSILKRSVLKLIRNRRTEVVRGANIGTDYARIKLNTDSDVVTAVSNAQYGVYRVSNNIAVSGGECAAVVCDVIMPTDFNEPELKTLMKDIESQCESLNIQIAGGNTSVSSAVNSPVVSITGIGYVDKNIDISTANIRPNQDIIMTKWIGIEGIRIICNNNSEKILKLYRQELIDTACGIEADMSVSRETAIVAQHNMTGSDNSMHDVSEGGIFAALWDMAEAGKVGIDIDFKKIAVKQEIIEICEIFDKNPYELASAGCLLVTSDNGCDIVCLLESAGIKAAIIGRTTAGNDKIIHNDDEIRYLDPPKRDEIYTII